MSQRSRFVELRPGPLSNKGGELMLVAMVGELGADFSLAVEPWIGAYRRRASLELYQKVGFRHRYNRVAGVATLLPRRLRDAFGLVTEVDIAAVLDASGFAYGDQHGPERSRRAAARARQWKKQSKKLVLMPQALGPFDDPDVARHARALFEAADLVYARDAASEDHARRLVPGASYIRRSPDFTIPLSGVPVDVVDAGADYACIVPNWRMQKATAEAVSSRYLPFLAMCVSSLQSRGLQVVVVIHEGAGDRELARELSSLVGHELRLVDDPDPLHLKSVLGEARLVIGSRYHALVGALSSCVPAIGTGWSHKYGTLFADFGVPELLVDPGIDAAEVDDLIARLVDGLERERLQAVLRDRVAWLSEQVDQMWREIRGLLGQM